MPRPTPIQLTSVQRVVNPESARIKGYDFATIHADHMGMTKFASRDTGYKRVLGLLQNWIGEFETSAGAVSAS